MLLLELLHILELGDRVLVHRKIRSVFDWCLANPDRLGDTEPFKITFYSDIKAGPRVAKDLADFVSPVCAEINRLIPIWPTNPGRHQLVLEFECQDQPGSRIKLTISTYRPIFPTNRPGYLRINGFSKVGLRSHRFPMLALIPLE